MALRHAVMIGLMGRQADRFHEYQPAAGLTQRLEMAARVHGMDGIEVVYPQDFDPEPDDAVEAIQRSRLTVAAVNLNVKGEPKYRAGSFTSPDPAIRADAVQAAKTAMDLAAELGASMITCCPLIDGHNYAFEADYTRQWPWLAECLGEVAAHRRDVRISLEYKPNESRNYCVLRDVGRTLYLCERLGQPHVGVTLDSGHALAAGETPAEALCLAAHANRLFYVHLNDNGREWDWDMLPGSVNLWDLFEMLHYMDRLKWDGWLAYDVLTRGGDPVEMMNTTIEIVKSAQHALNKIGHERLAEFIAEGSPARTFRHLLRSLG